MSIKKSLLALAVAAMATMAFASPAMAGGGKIVEHIGTAPIQAGTVLHTIGSVSFTAGGVGSLECHVTSTVEASGATGETGLVREFTIPDTTKCTGTGGLAGCKVKFHKSDNLPYHATVTGDGRIHVTGNIVLTTEFSNCLAKSITLTFSDVTLTPLKTGSNPITGTLEKLGGTAALNETIAGFEIDGTIGPGGVGTGKADITNIFGGKSEEAVTISGNFELSEPARCTYEIIKTI